VGVKYTGILLIKLSEFYSEIQFKLSGLIHGYAASERWHNFLFRRINVVISAIFSMSPTPVGGSDKRQVDTTSKATSKLRVLGVSDLLGEKRLTRSD
jgi:hypothetical protein